jgi:D-alanyl-D-alanine carboxypeptidase (penicillin-binding protein 5/6)
MKAVMIHSANDAAVAVAEHITGSTESFVDLMNHKAGELGMQDSEFYSVHGLPPGRGQSRDTSSPYDMALLARALVQYPKVLEWTSTPEEPFRDGKFMLHNTNRLLNRYKGLDGLKTGYIRESGFCITATAARESSRMIAVVMGAPNNGRRSSETTRLLTRGFEMYKSVKLAGAGQPLKTRLPVSKGKSRDIGLRYAGDLAVSVKSNQGSGLNVKEELPQSVKAPVYEGDVVGKATAMLGDKALRSVDIVAAETVEKGSFLQSLFH